MHRDLLRTHRPCARSGDSRSVCDPCQVLQQSGTTAVEVDPRKRDEPEATRRLKHLDTYFGARRLVSIGPDDCTAYAAKRRGVGAANGTINRELNVLGRLLSLAVENKKLLVKPIIRKLDEAPPRAGFFEQDQYQAVRRHLPRTSRWPSRSCTPSGGGRWKCSIWSAATWILAAGTLPLDPGSTKNGESRTVYLTPEIKALLAAQVERVKALEKKLGRIIRALFPHLHGAKTQSVGARHVAVIGEPIRDFRRIWATACKRAGCPGMLRHDFRRTAVRNMEQAGAPRSGAMKMTGHRTENLYRRYAIVSASDLKRGSDLLAQAAK